MNDEDLKLWADRKRTVLSYIDEERARCLALIMAIDDENFLLYCITESYTVVELEQARNIYDALQPVVEPVVASDDIEDLM